MKQQCKQIFSLLLTLALCAGLLAAFATPASAFSLEEKQRAVALTAFAYYDKEHAMQYDSALLSVVAKDNGGAIRTTHAVSPEYVTPDETGYSVCSDFCYQVYFDTFGYKLCGNPISCWTGKLSKFDPEKDPICVYRYISGSSKLKRDEALTEFLSVIQPGDVVNACTTLGGSGHAMIYVGDALGDGTKYLIHCAGTKYDTASGHDNVEGNPLKLADVPGQVTYSDNADRKNGAIMLSNAEEYLRKNYSEKGLVLSAIRPLGVIKDEENPLTPAAQGRLQYPRFVYNRTASATRFGDVEAGGTLTLKIELKNESGKAYTVPVKETIPEGVTFVKASDGGAVSGKEISWSVQLPAGGSKTLTVDYTVAAKRGEMLTLGGGSAGTIPSNTLRVYVGGKKLTAEETAKLSAIAKGEVPALFKGVSREKLPNVVWQKLLGLNVIIPDPKTVVNDVLKRQTVSGMRVYLPRKDLKGDLLTYRDMLVNEFCGGFSWGEMNSLKRVLDLKDDYLEPGDVVYEITKGTQPDEGQTLICLGEGKYLFYDRAKKEIAVTGHFELQKAHTYDLFFALRPTLACDDVHTLPALPQPPAFTDVKESDWFYEYVTDLATEGVVNGMTATTFAPNGTLTYGQALKLIALAVGEAEPAKSGTHWASGYLTLAKSKSWLTEDVNLDGTITRLQLCKIAAKAKKLTVQPSFPPFTDTSDPDVLALYQAGVINGMTETEFRPNGLLTRAQISKIIWTMRKV